MPTLAKRPKRTRGISGPPQLAAGPWTQGLLCAFSAGWCTPQPYHDPCGVLWTAGTPSGLQNGPLPVIADEPHVQGTFVRGSALNSVYQASIATSTADSTAIWAGMVSGAGAGNGGAWGAGSAIASPGERFAIYWPYSGSILFDYGGSSSPNRITYAAPADFYGRWHTAGVRAGALGSQYWQDGTLRAAQGSAITRAAGTGTFYIGQDGISGAANWLDVNLSILLIWSYWLPDALFTSLLANPYQVLQSGANVPRLPGGPFTAGQSWPDDMRGRFVNMTGGFCNG